MKTVACWCCIVAVAALAAGCDSAKKQTSTLTDAQKKEVTQKASESMDKNMEVMKGAPAGIVPQKPGGGDGDMKKFFPAGGPPGAPAGAIPGSTPTPPAKEATPSAPPK